MGQKLNLIPKICNICFYAPISQCIKSHILGVTSYATLYNGYTDTMEKMLRRLELDLYYLEHNSLWLDMKILAKTFLKIVEGKKF